MKNILHFLKKSNLAILCIVLLLVVQAYCDLKLPDYTSDLLNTGLQQNGIESTVPDTIRADSLSVLELFLSDEDTETVENAYGPADDSGIRTLADDVDTDALDALLTMPECIVYQMQSSEDASYTPDQLLQAVDSGMLTKQQLQENLAETEQTLSAMGDSMLSQAAVNYVAAEYEAQGVDMSSVRSAYLYKVGGRMLIMALVMMVVSVLTGLLASITSAKIGRGLRGAIYEKVMAFTGAEMEKFSTASLITRSTNDIQQVQMVIVMLLRMVAYAPILAIGGIIMVLRTGAGMSWIIALAVIVLAACFGVLLAVAMPKFRKMQVLVDDLNLVSREQLTGIMPIRAFSREKFEEQRFDGANRALYSTQLFTNRVMSFMTPVMMFVMNGISVLIVWVGAKRIDAGVIQIGDMTAFITYAMVIVMGFLMLGMICIILPRAGVAADRIVEVIETPVTMKDPEAPRDSELSDAKGMVEFHNVSFCYPGAGEPAVRNISFTAEPGKTTAIIGSTGCGKSTIMNLIPRFYDVTSGSITVDGVDIREITRKKLRSLLGYVPQKGMLFSGTVESNIKYGGTDITDADMLQAAEIAQAQEFIESKPEQYASAIAQGGTNVSGGQKQRLSIARAIAKHPKVFLFDDSFSALDYKTDLALRRELAEQTGDAAVIIVAQRISTILHADRIVVLDDGQIVGIGTHEQLMASCDTYREIARSQLSESELSDTEKGGE